jgi:hypothetical protein
MAVNVGQGTILQATITSSLTPIFQLLEGDGPEVSVPKKDKTNLGDVLRRYRAQLPDLGEANFTVQYDPADGTHHFLVTQILIWPQPIIAWKLIFNTASGTAGATFQAFLNKFSPKGYNQEDNLEADIGLTLDGVAFSWTF